MNPTSLMLWHSLLQKEPPSTRAALINCLTVDLQNDLNIQPEAALDFAGLFTSPKTELDLIHYSWFAPFLRSLTEREIKLFLSALNPKQSKA